MAANGAMCRVVWGRLRAAGAIFLLMCGLFGCGHAAAQDVRALTERHERIDALYQKEDYPGVIHEVEALLLEMEGTAFADSLHRYLYKYARAYRKVRNAEAGAEAGERIYALIRTRPSTERELEALFDLSWYYYDIGELKECARVDSIAVAEADRDAGISQALRGRARQYLAFDHSVLGNHARSAEWALAALDVYSKADSIPPTQWAESHTAVGVAYWHLGRIRAAEEHYQSALARLGDRTDMASLIRKVSTNGNLGVMWQNAGDLVRAKTYYYASLRLSDEVIAGTTDPFTRDESIVNRSRTYLNLATVYAQLGDDGRARALLELAWKDRSSVLEPGDPQLLVVKNAMADLELDRGALDRAEALVTEYMRACERGFGHQSEEYIRSCSKLGEVAQRKGQYARADSLFRVSIDASRTKADAATDVVLAATYQRRARLHLDQGRKKEALSDLLLAREVMVRTYDSAHYKVAGIDVLLAEAAFRAGDADAALRHSASAMVLMKERSDALRATRLPIAFLDPQILPDAIYWNVMARRALAGPGVVEPQWNALIDLAITSLSRNKEAVDDEASKLLLIGSQKRLFDLAMAVAFDAYARSGSASDVERFLALSEADRSILLKGRLNDFAGLRFAGVPDSVTVHEQELIAALDIDAADRASATAMGQREAAYTSFLARLERDHPKYFELRYGEPTPGLDELRAKLLAPDRQMLAYAVAEEHLYILVLDRKQVSLVRTSNAGVTEAARSLNEAIVQRRTGDWLKSAFALYQLVVAPVADKLTAPELLIIPDGPLHQVNFETLISRASTGQDYKEALLLQRYTIAYLLSATTALQFASLSREHARGALAMAPGFDDPLKKSYVEQVKDTALLDHAYLDRVRQPFAQTTARGLGDLFSARVMLGDQASERSFRELADEYGILHLGTHAEMNEGSPMYSRLVLSKDGAGMEAHADGYLHAYEIYELDLRAQLAVLTACETGVGRNERGEGIRSIGYGFAYAGCPSLVTSLWEIDEKASSEIITRFYENLADGMPKHLALRQAKLDHLADASEELQLPYYWAGLVLVGDVGPVPVGTSWWLIALWVAGAAGLLLFFFRWRGRSRRDA